MWMKVLSHQSLDIAVKNGNEGKTDAAQKAAKEASEHLKAAK